MSESEFREIILSTKGCIDKDYSSIVDVAFSSFLRNKDDVGRWISNRTSNVPSVDQSDSG